VSRSSRTTAALEACADVALREARIAYEAAVVAVNRAARTLDTARTLRDAIRAEASRDATLEDRP
jgi:hypothetical protein